MLYTALLYAPLYVTAATEKGTHAMWKVGVLVQPGFKAEGFFFNHLNTKRTFPKCQFLDFFFPKRAVLPYGFGL